MSSFSAGPIRMARRVRAVLASIAFGRPNALVKGQSPLIPPYRKEKCVLRKRPIKLSLRLNEEEHKHLKMMALMTGFSIEQYLRNLIMGEVMKPRPKTEIAEIKRQLAAIGNNVNQIAKIANTYDRVRQTDVEYIVEMQTKIWLMMKRL